MRRSPNRSLRTTPSRTLPRLRRRKLAQVGLDDARADKFVLIYADEETIDLRVRVNGDDGCSWFGVGGFVEDGKIRWSNAGSGDGQPCN